MEPGVSRDLARRRAESISDVRYRLSLELTPGATRLKGRIEIKLRLRRLSDDVVLDFRDLDDNGKLIDGTINAVTVNRQALTPKQSNGHISLPGKYFKSGENTIALEFESGIATAGRPVTRYLDRDDGNEYIYTLLVPMDASLAFPCFDQPDVKARFTLDITAPANWVVIGNSAIRETAAAERAGFRRTSFQESPPISSYLFAFAAGPFEALGSNGSPVPLRVLVRKSKLSRAREEWPEVERLSRDGMRHLTEFFAQPFPFSKYDQVLIPGFAYGGMEHAGATFLREDAILFRTTPTLSDKLGRASLILHELSHQWFGDLVTMRWFDDLWLKEGFANYMASHTMATLFPADMIWKRFYQAHKPAAYAIDSTRGTTPIYQEVPNLADAKSAYGAIVYQKAPSILRALSFRIGERGFRDGVRLFLKTHSYGNAEWSDLIKDFETASGQSLGDWASAWVRQRGMPQVDIDWSCGADGKIDRLELRQSDVLNEGGHWPIRTQLLLAYDDAPAERLTVDLMGERAPVRELTGRRCPAYIFGNEGDFGYGRFLLDARSRVAVTSRLTHITDPFLRTMLLGALWEAVRETQMPPEEYVALVLKLLAAENDEELAQSMLARATTAFQRYLSPAQRTELAPALEALCSQRMVSAEPLGLRITFYRAFRSLATTDTARQHLKDLLAGKFSIPGMELKPLDRWQIVRVLLTLADAEAERLFAGERKRDISDDGRKLAYVVEASRSDEATKRRYFDDYLLNRQVPEDWIEGSLGGFNSWNQSQVTFQFLKPALEALPQIKRERKIFFVLSWLNAFIGGQQSAEALGTVRDFLEAGKLDRDLKLKVMEVMDELERTVRINAKAQGRKDARRS
jgi:aminopeptidase N